MVSDMVLLVISFVGLSIIAGVILYLAGVFDAKKKDKTDDEEEGGRRAGRRGTGGLAGLRKRKGKGKARARDGDEEEMKDEQDDEDFDDRPMTKKEQLKEMKRQEREELRRFDEAQREERKKRNDEKEDAYRKKLEAREAIERKKEEDAEKLAREIEEKKQQEFDQWKDMFSVEEAGSKAEDLQHESSGLLEEFIEYIKQHKVVVLEDLAMYFQMHTQDVIQRVEKLEEMDRLTGIVDDRGKFIYITPDELERVASYIEKKGRIAITDLASESNRLINLKAEVVDPEPDTIFDDDDIMQEKN